MTNTPQQEFSNKLKQYLDSAELLLGIMVAIALIFRMQHWPGGGVMLTFLLSTFACLYFFIAFSQENDPYMRKFDVFIHKIIYWGLSVAAIGLLFTLQRWPNGTIMTTMGALAITPGLLYALNVRRERPELTLFNNRLLLRCVVFAALCVAALVYA